jgi:hypothetical protein
MIATSKLQMNNKTLDMGIGFCFLIPPFYGMVDVTKLISTIEVHFVSRRPIPIPSRIDNVITVFTANVWIAILGTILVFALLFLIVHTIYNTKHLNNYGLAGKLHAKYDFFLLTFSTLMEPDPLPWFPKHSTGNLFNTKEIK